MNGSIKYKNLIYFSKILFQMKIFDYFNQTKRPYETRNEYDNLKIVLKFFFWGKNKFFYLQKIIKLILN